MDVAVAILAGLAGLAAGILLTLLKGPSAAVRASEREIRGHLAQLKERLAAVDTEQAQTEEVLAVMGDGVLVLDEESRVLRANPAASRLLGAPLGEKGGTPLVHAARSFGALPLVDRALSAGETLTEQFELPGSRFLSVQAIPMQAGSTAGRRIVLVIRDETDRLRTERVRRDFVANVSHELKTPLARLSLLASTLRYAVHENPAEAEDFLERLRAEVDRLGVLLSDLLTLSQLEERRAAMDEELVDLAHVTEAAAADLEATFSEEERHLAVETEPAPVRGDRVALETMVRNLLDNGLRYTNLGGHVRVTVASEDNEAVLRVQDDGLGIPRAEQARVFERFYRVDKARSRDTGGTGLGLSIVRHVAEQHGGRVELQSAVGVGSTFTVRLPLACALERPDL